MEMGKCPTPALREDKEEKKFASDITKVSKAFGDIHQCISLLESKISPILIPAAPVNGVKNPTTSKVQSEWSTFIEALLVEIEDVKHELNSLRSRSEI
jgi:hypothetical protein